MAGNWICPHCEHASYVTDNLMSNGSVAMTIDNHEGPFLSYTHFMDCTS